jgi:hypothetical protein
MRITARTGVLKGPEGLTPPEPFITVEDNEGAALVRSGVALPYDGDAAAAVAEIAPLVIGVSAEYGDGQFIAQALVDGLPHGEPEVVDLPLISGDVSFADGHVLVQLLVDGQTHGLPIVEVLPGVTAPAVTATLEFVDGKALARIFVDGVEYGDPIVEALPVAEPAEAAAEHNTDLADALELIDDDGLVKTGPRTGKPKVDVIKALVGTDVTAEQIDAAWDARAAAQ